MTFKYTFICNYFLYKDIGGGNHKNILKCDVISMYRPMHINTNVKDKVLAVKSHAIQSKLLKVMYK